MSLVKPASRFRELFLKDMAVLTSITVALDTTENWNSSTTVRF